MVGAGEEWPRVCFHLPAPYLIFGVVVNTV